MKNIFLAYVSSIGEVSVDGGTGPSEKKIFVKPYSRGDDLAPLGQRELEVLPPSITPTDNMGGGTLSTPVVGQRCLVYYDIREPRGQILSYTINQGLSPYGHYVNKDMPAGSTSLGIGGMTPSHLTLAPDGKIFLESDPAFSSIRIFGKNQKIIINARELEIFKEIGFSRDSYTKKDHFSGENFVTSHVSSYSRFAEKRLLFSDRDSYAVEAVPEIRAPEYVDKVLFKSGSIFNNNFQDPDSLQTHVYEIDTLQSTVSGTDKDTVMHFKFGYQDEHKKFKDDVYSAGTMYEWMAKRNDVSGQEYSSLVFRYGEQESSSDSETMAGEIFRFQIFNNTKELIGDPLLDPVGEGKGYNYIFNNKASSFQYSDSYGLLYEHDDLNDTFYRHALHNWDSHSLGSVSTPTGQRYEKVFGGENYFKKNYDIYDSGEIVTTVTEFFNETDDGQYNFNMSTDSENRNYKITFGSDTIEISFNNEEDSIKANLKLNKDEILLSLSTADNPNKSPYIKMDKDGNILIHPGDDKSEGSIKIGNNGFGHQLVTKEWIETIFNSHMHPTAGTGPPSPPIPVTAAHSSTQASHLTYVTVVE